MMKKLSTQTAFASLVTTLLGVSLIAFIIIGLVKDLITNHLENEKVNTVVIAKKALTLPLWNYDESYIQEVLNSFIDENLNTIVAIKLTASDSKKEYFASSKKYDFRKINELINTKEVSILSDTIEHRNKLLGEFKIYYSTTTFKNSFTKLQIIVAVITVCLGLLFAFSSFSLLKRWLTNPLNDIAMDAKKVGHGDYEVKFKTDYIGELNIVTEAFNETIEAIHTRDRQLHDQNNKLEGMVKNRTKDLESFSYSVSHDLRAPLRGIDGWSLALLEDYGNVLDDKGKTYLDRVRSEAQRMGNLIDSLLSLSRITRSEMKEEKVDLSAMMKTIAIRSKDDHPNSKVQLIIQENMSTMGDSHYLEIALTNLFENAWKFSCKNEFPVIEFASRLIDGQTVFYIKDNGAGFDMSKATNLFKAFQRMHKTSEYPGNGIGLATVERIIVLHRGKIWAESAVNQGAIFYFTLHDPNATEAL